MSVEINIHLGQPQPYKVLTEVIVTEGVKVGFSHESKPEFPLYAVYLFGPGRENLPQMNLATDKELEHLEPPLQVSFFLRCPSNYADGEDELRCNLYSEDGLVTTIGMEFYGVFTSNEEDEDYENGRSLFELVKHLHHRFGATSTEAVESIAGALIFEISECGEEKFYQ